MRERHRSDDVCDGAGFDDQCRVLLHQLQPRPTQVVVVAICRDNDSSIEASGQRRNRRASHQGCRGFGHATSVPLSDEEVVGAMYLYP